MSWCWVHSPPESSQGTRTSSDEGLLTHFSFDGTFLDITYVRMECWLRLTKRHMAYSWLPGWSIFRGGGTINILVQSAKLSFNSTNICTKKYIQYVICIYTIYIYIYLYIMYTYIYDISTCHIGKHQTLNVLEESKDIPICPDPLTSGSAIESDQSSDFAPASPPHLLPCFHLHLLLHPPRCRTWAITKYPLVN